MTTTMTITLLIITAVSIALNVFQFMERKAERKQHHGLIAEAARLEDSYNELKATYENEKLHKEWAIGRIKDQQAVIDQLKKGVMPKKSKKEADHVR